MELQLNQTIILFLSTLKMHIQTPHKLNIGCLANQESCYMTRHYQACILILSENNKDVLLSIFSCEFVHYKEGYWDCLFRQLMLIIFISRSK